MPDRVTVVDEASLVWDTPAPAGDSWPGTDNLLDHFCELESAHPEEMADFLRWYGLPELCFEHGRPDHHTEGEYCPLTTGDTWTSLSVRHLRIAARAYSAIRRGSARLAIRQSVDEKDWLNLQVFIGGFSVMKDRSFFGQRSWLAEYLRWLFMSTGIGHDVTWPRGAKHPQLSSEADGLLGTITLLLWRDITGDRETYRCDVCRMPVERIRPPREGERIYCTEPTCRRERQRRNQAAYRARQRGEQP
jgi:hypothetical protein